MRPLFSLPLPDGLIVALNKSGFQHVEDLHKTNLDCEEEALVIIESYGLTWDDIKTCTADTGSVTVSQLLRKEQFSERIPTFSESLDSLLGGGVQTDSIVQVCGPPGSGKTQLGLQLCVNVQIPVSLGGLGAESVFIDTEGTFCPKRIREIATAASDHCRSVAHLHNIEGDVDSFTAEYILSRIHYIGVGNLVQLVSSIQRLYELLEQNLNVKLIVIDSITYPFLKMANFLERTQLISTIAQNLQDLVEKFNLCIVINNHLTTKINQENKVLTPALGESLTHLLPTTILLGFSNNFSALLYKSNKLKEDIVHFKITPEGIRDI